jgi:hypothetical protein
VNYIYNKKTVVVDNLKKYFENDTTVLDSLFDESPISDNAVAFAKDIVDNDRYGPYAQVFALSLILKHTRTGTVTFRKLLEDETGVAAAIGMLMFTAAAGVSEPLHEIDLDCQGSIEDNGDRTFTISIGEIKSSKEAAKSAVIQLDCRLQVIEAALQAAYENLNLANIKVGYLFLPQSSRYSASEQIPESSIGAIIRTDYM